MTKTLLINLVSLLILVSFAAAAVPTHDTPLLNESSNPYNLTGYNQSTADADGDTVVNNYCWYNDSIQIGCRFYQNSINSYWPLDSNNVLDYGGANDGSDSGTTYRSNGKVLGYRNFTGSTYIDVGNPNFLSRNNFSISFWIRCNGINQDSGSVVIASDAGSGTFIIYACEDATANLRIEGGIFDNAMTLSDLQWHYISYVKQNTASHSLYLDGALFNTSTSSLAAFNSADIFIGKHPSYAQYFIGGLDEFTIYDAALTAEQVKGIYQSTRTGFTADEQGAILLSDYTSPGDTWIFEVKPYDSTGSGIAKNSSVLTVAAIANFSITASTFYFGDILNSFNATINGKKYTTDTGSIITSNLRTDSDILNITLTAYKHDTRYYYNYVANVDLATTLNYSYYKLNVTVKDYKNTGIGNFSVDAISAYDTITGNSSDSSIVLETLRNASYNVIVDNDRYSLGNKTILMDYWERYLNFSLYYTNAIDFIFKDEVTKEIINKTITIEFIGSLNSYNYTSPNGTFYIDLISPDNYAIRYDSSLYHERFYFLTLINRTYNNLTLYLLNTSLGTTITATVYDETNTLIEDVYITALRYDVDTNAYFTVEEAKTNFEGAAELFLQKNTEYYKFYLYYPYDTLKKTTSPTYIFEDSINFMIVTAQEVAENFYNYLGITHELTFNNATNNFRFDYTDNSNVMTSVCLEIWKMTDGNKVLFNTSCLTSSAGSILLHIDRINGTRYEANAFGYIGGEETFLEGLTQFFSNPSQWNIFGLFGVLLLTLVFIFVMKYNIELGVILAPIPIIIGSAFEIINFPVGMAFVIEILAFIVAILIHRWK